MNIKSARIKSDVALLVWDKHTLNPKWRSVSIWAKGERDLLEQIDDLVERIESFSCCEVWRWVALGNSEMPSGRRHGLAEKKMKEWEATSDSEHQVGA